MRIHVHRLLTLSKKNTLHQLGTEFSIVGCCVLLYIPICLFFFFILIFFLHLNFLYRCIVGSVYLRQVIVETSSKGQSLLVTCCPGSACQNLYNNKQQQKQG